MGKLVLEFVCFDFVLMGVKTSVEDSIQFDGSYQSILHR